jgi:sugar phosphate isomerase/epimerase
MIDLYTAVIEKLKSMNYAGILWVEACRQKTVSIEKLEEKTGLFDKVYKQGTSYLGVKDFS